MQPIEIVYILFAYLISAVPFGVLLSRIISGKDVRQHGSGNIGATNVSRMMGKKWGVMVLFLDALKGYVAVGLAKHIGPGWYCNLIAMVAVSAHCYPVYLKFKGGKGVATGLGVLAALSWPITGICALVFAITCGLSRRISPASLAGALSLPISAFFIHGNLTVWCGFYLCTLIWWKHKENIRRLVAGDEPRFF